MKEFTRIEPTTVQEVGGHFKQQAVVKHFQTGDGLVHEFTTWGEEGTCAAGVLAVTSDGKVVTTHQFRSGPERWMYDLPGGGLEAGEDPQTGALRELREEAGYVAGDVAFLGTSSRDAYCNHVWHYYLATGCVPSEDGRELDKEELDQGAEVRLISIAEFLEHAKHDRMSDPAAVLMAYDKLKEIESNG